MKKIVKYTHRVKSGKNSKFIVLYEDGTWEELFKFNEHGDIKWDSCKKFHGKTRDEAIDLYHKSFEEEA